MPLYGGGGFAAGAYTWHLSVVNGGRPRRDGDGDDLAPTYTPVVSPRGIRPHTTFTSASDIEAIDTASGALTLSVPLGQAYEVGPILRYQLRAVYNSRVWQHVSMECDLGDGQRRVGAGQGLR